MHNEKNLISKTVPKNRKLDFNKYPTFTPPQFSPKINPQNGLKDYNLFKNCIGCQTYIWLNNSQSFWFYPIEIGPYTATGYYWNHDRWKKVMLRLAYIRSFF